MGTDAVVRLGRHLQRRFVTRRQLRSSLSSIYLRLIVINTSDTAGKVQHVSIVFQKHTNKVAWWDDNRPRRARCKASWYFLFCKCITALILWPLAKEKPQRQTDVLRFSCFTLFRRYKRRENELQQSPVKLKPGGVSISTAVRFWGTFTVMFTLMHQWL